MLNKTNGFSTHHTARVRVTAADSKNDDYLRCAMRITAVKACATHGNCWYIQKLVTDGNIKGH